MTTAIKERPILFGAPMIRALLAGTKTQTRWIIKPQPPPDCTDCRVDYTHGKPIATYRSFPNGGSARTGLCECPYGDVGDYLWVREAFYSDTREPLSGTNPAIIYAATPEIAKCKLDAAPIFCTHLDDSRVTRDEAILNLKDHRFQRLTSPIFMPRWASRIDRVLREISIERVQDITEADAIAEGLETQGGGGMGPGPGYKWIGTAYHDGFSLDPTWGKTWHAPLYGTCCCTVGRREKLTPARCAYRHLWDHINGDGAWDRNDWVWKLTFRRVEPLEGRPMP